MGRAHYRAKDGRWVTSERQRVRDAHRPDPSGCHQLESCLRSKDSRAVWRGTGRKGSNDLARGLLYLLRRSRLRQRLTPGVDMICIANDCAKRTYITTFRQLLAQSLSKSSDFMICV